MGVAFASLQMLTRQRANTVSYNSLPEEELIVGRAAAVSGRFPTQARLLQR
jgi:hypothetical protein